MYIMLFVIIIFYLKFSIYMCLIGALIGFMVMRYKKKRNAINQSDVILKSLVKTKFG
jgi:membrane glycosyltransferase